MGQLSMSDKGIYGASGSDSGSEIDEPNSDINKPSLGAVGRDNEYEKLEKKVVVIRQVVGP